MSDDGGYDPLDGSFHPSLDDAVFRAMSDRTRRLVLYFLVEHDDASFERLADVVTGWSAVGTQGMATPADRERTQTLLHHRHLPVLEDAGLIVRDDDAVRIATLPEPVSDLIEWSLRTETASGAPSTRDRDGGHK